MVRKFAAPLVCAIAIASMRPEAVQAALFKPTFQPLARTYVSGTGNDSNPCTATAPCLTFQAALALTTAGGEIFVLDSANYGPVTINKAVSITSEGAIAGVLATGAVGITINAGPNDVINLRGLDIDGGNVGAVGIQFKSGGLLNIQKSLIRGFTNSGISFTPNAASTLVVSDAVVTGNASNGILISASGPGAVTAVVNRLTASRNGVGILAYGTNVSLTIADTVANNNSYGIGASSSAVMVRNSTVSNNAVGLAADQSAVVRMGQSTITANATAWTTTNSGQVLSFGNNNVGGNTVNGTLTKTIALQ